MVNQISQFISVMFLLSMCSFPVQAQIPSLGRCPKVAVVANFNTEAYLGRWYEQEKYPFVFELAGKCVTAEYGLNDDGTVSVANRQLNIITGAENSIRGSAKIVHPAKFAVKFPTPFNVESPYWVIGTDYTDYAVVFSCTDFGGLLSTKVAWILTRERFPGIVTMKKAYAVLDAAKISRAFLTRTDQKNCVTEQYVKPIKK